MQILITGFSQRMANSQKLRYDYRTSVYLLVDALREMGHEVHHRRVQFGENLDNYDLALVGYAPPKSLTSRHCHESCWALQTVKRCLLFADDWSIAAAGGNTESAIRCMPQWSEFMKFSTSEATTVAIQLQLILDGKWSLLAPMFPWGNYSKLLKNNLDNLRMFAWDPTPYVVVENEKCQTKKERGWVYATLQDHEPWLATLNPQWPVERYGSYRAKDKYISEKNLLQRYAAKWGVLCPEYKSAGSGWWRMRYQHAASLGCVLKCGVTDGLSMNVNVSSEYGPYCYPLAKIEAMSDTGLADLAEWQRDTFFAHVNTKQQSILQLVRALESVVTR